MTCCAAIVALFCVPRLGNPSVHALMLRPLIAPSDRDLALISKNVERAGCRMSYVLQGARDDAVAAIET
ncbi:MAG: hypothetical protein KF861_04580 [Planctomycetaceae bacterium]|nr:hypothetical protein [Planctomycetaceae bacterium]